MKKCKLFTLLLCALFIFTYPSLDTMAASGNLYDNTKIVIEQGVTEDGIPYTVYLETSAPDIVTPNIVVSKFYRIAVTFQGNAKPSDTWNTSMTDDGITYSGTLYLKGYEYDNFGPSKYTMARYEGTLFARI